jgi:hypothetical protein
MDQDPHLRQRSSRDVVDDGPDLGAPADEDQQANTLAGLHADYILFILDESGGIPTP